MTIEEAINVLFQVKSILINSNSWLESTKEPIMDAFNMAIEALSKSSEIPNSSDDLINRQVAIDAMTNTLWHYPNECYRNLNEYEFAKGLAELGLKSVPSAQPEQHWIPCSERLPTKYGFYLVTLNNYCTDFCIWNGKEFGMGTNKKWSRCDEVTAWMPLPEPYKGES